MLRPFKYIVPFGDVYMGFEDLGEAIFAATGCYEFVQGLGYPSIIGAFVETALGVEPYGTLPAAEEEFDGVEYLEVYEWTGAAYVKLPLSEVI